MLSALTDDTCQFKAPPTSLCLHSTFVLEYKPDLELVSLVSGFLGQNGETSQDANESNFSPGCSDASNVFTYQGADDTSSPQQNQSVQTPRVE